MWLQLTNTVTGGRNYETYSEDPVVLGVLAAAFVNGAWICYLCGRNACP